MGEFARELAGGRSLTGALAAAQRTAIDFDVPAGARSGWIVMSDGEMVPVPGGIERRGAVREAIVWALGACVVAVALVAAYWWSPRLFPR
jgi:hypothetical protein